MVPEGALCLRLSGSPQKRYEAEEEARGPILLAPPFFCLLGAPGVARPPFYYALVRSPPRSQCLFCLPFFVLLPLSAASPYSLFPAVFEAGLKRRRRRSALFCSPFLCTLLSLSPVFLLFLSACAGSEQAASLPCVDHVSLNSLLASPCVCLRNQLYKEDNPQPCLEKTKGRAVAEKKRTQLEVGGKD